MPLACPVCKAENAAGPSCRRCKADLTMLFALADSREELLDAARSAYEHGHVADAWQYAVVANEQREDAESLRWSAMLNLVHGNFGEAWRAYRALTPHA